ncbi:MAG: response regulator [bacterium]|nr:response regulator [bacterium]
MKTILILDDENAIRLSFVDYFEDRMWRTLEANSAEKALELLKHAQPDAAIVDIRLPGMDGNNFVREVYRRNIKMAFILTTGSPEYRLSADLLALEVPIQLIRKPVVNLAGLEEVILKMMEHKDVF